MIEKLKMQTPDRTSNNIEQIAMLFPHVITESKDKDGNLQKAIDFDLLKQSLSNVLVGDENERYRLDWPGKKAALLKANTPITKTLRPCREESVNFDSTRNVYIEGDNFEVLKILQESYLGKIKMIYIDPPYNTGKDFIYKDNYAISKDEYADEIGAIDVNGGKLFKNTDANGRFHSDWLSMMYERLIIARDLLRNDGVIFISIDDNEVHNLRKLCDEIFGENNCVGQITWKARVKPINIGDAKYRPQKEVEYVLVYQKQDVPDIFAPLYNGSERSYPHEANGRKYRMTTILKSNRGTNQRSTMVFPLGDYIPPEGQRWQAGENVIEQLQKDGYIEFKNGTPFKRYYEDEESPEHNPFYCFMENYWSSTSEAGKSELNHLVGENHDFDTVKPCRLLQTFVTTTTKSKKGDIILDFFSGSATTAHAVMQQNSNDNGNRKFIMVQLPAKTDKKSKAHQAGFKTIADIGKARIRRAGAKIVEENKDKSGIGNLDIGFRVYKKDSTNMKDVYYHPTELTQDALLAMESNIKEDRTPDDLLTQIILDLGLTLDLPIEKIEMLGNTVFIVQNNDLVACFDDNINFKIIDQIADLHPQKAVFKDASFANDNDRINIENRLKRLSPETTLTVI